MVIILNEAIKIDHFCAKCSFVVHYRQHLYGEARTADDYAAAMDNMGKWELSGVIGAQGPFQ